MRQTIAGLILAAPVLLGSSPPGTSVELDASRPLVTIGVDGRPTIIEVAPDGPDGVIVNAAVAQQLGKKGSMIGGRHMVGRTAVSASSNTAKVDYGDGRAIKNRVFWFGRDWTEMAEGRVGPARLPRAVVTYRLRTARAGERAIVLPMMAPGRIGLRSQIVIDGVPVPIAFTFDRPETMVTAATGALLARVHDGRMTGDAREAKLEMGFQRPVRPLTVATPLMLGGLELRDLIVRTVDTGSTASIPDAQQDPSEIVVTAGGKGKVVHGIFVGSASFAGCSTLTFDKPKAQIRLSCL